MAEPGVKGTVPCGIRGSMRLEVLGRNSDKLLGAFEELQSHKHRSTSM